MRLAPAMRAAWWLGEGLCKRVRNAAAAPHLHNRQADCAHAEHGHGGPGPDLNVCECAGEPREDCA